MNKLNLILSCIYPNYCGLCNKIDENGICKRCEIKLNQYKKYNIEIYKDISFNMHISLFPYQGIIRDKLIEYKFQKKPYLARMFATLIRREERVMKIINDYDYIIPVPIHKKRKQERGYNQSELILRYTVLEKNKINANFLKKQINNLPQSSLNKEERKLNVKNVYTVENRQRNNLGNKTILLFDDIFTTGNTVRECSNILKQEGASIIDVLTIAKD